MAIENAGEQNQQAPKSGSDGDLLRLYELVFENWRWQVDSNWTRTSYFAVFETALLGAVWEIGSKGHMWSGVFGALVGILLTADWILNDVKAGAYIEYWWRSLGNLEGHLAVMSGQKKLNFVSEYEWNRKDYCIPKSWPTYRCVMLAVPGLFLIAFVYCLGFAVSYHYAICRRAG